MNAKPQLPPQNYRSPRGARLVALLMSIFLIVVLSAEAQEYQYISLPAAGYGWGINPVGAPVQDEAGNIYGVTQLGDSYYPPYYGTILEVTRTGKPTVLYRFTSCEEPYTLSGLAIDKAGNLYGTGACGAGNVFKLDTTGAFTVLYNFQGDPDGEEPWAAPIVDSSGNLYGTTVSGGGRGTCIGGCGTVFKVDSEGNETVLYGFQGTPDGQGPESSLIEDSNGNLYGTTPYGGAYGWGTVFKLDTAGNETVLYSFQGGPDGGMPFSNLLLDSQGNLYGTASEGGEYDRGTVFKLDSSGNETVLYAFTGVADGYGPLAGLVAGRTGDLYGTASGGSSDFGVVFKLDPNGNETILHNFAGTDGSNPSGLLRDAAEYLYGTAYTGGSGYCNPEERYPGCGVVFRIKP